MLSSPEFCPKVQPWHILHHYEGWVHPPGAKAYNSNKEWILFFLVNKNVLFFIQSELMVLYYITFNCCEIYLELSPYLIFTFSPTKYLFHVGTFEHVIFFPVYIQEQLMSHLLGHQRYILQHHGACILPVWETVGSVMWQCSTCHCLYWCL